MRDWLIKILGGTPPMTEEEAQAALNQDLSKIIRKVKRMVKSYPHISPKLIVTEIERAIVKE